MVEKIEILVPVYNDLRILRLIDNLETIGFNGKLTVFEGCKNANYIEEIHSKLFDINLVVVEDDGIYDAFNMLLDYSTEDIICMLGCDDLFEDDFNFVSVCELLKHNDIVIPEIKYFSQHRTSIVRHVNYKSYRASDFFKGKPMYHVGVFFRKSIISILRFDNNYKACADFKFYLELFVSNPDIRIGLSSNVVLLESGGASGKLVNRTQNYLSMIYIFGRYNIYYPYHFVVKIFYKLRSLC
jgi:glycosyltransferase involved in cell wall biosynthesis